ncbi:alpha/beta hydrolase [Paludibaculum fermentans]|uniref:Alpha/beta hydrolase n=2 Tax=Paludibaculum fermentans TaxID=1473598 RepID=A0A7S7NYQ4_PALFE|nr:alpha/beta hydrolase [Paludibaculum fermentans]
MALNTDRAPAGAVEKHVTSRDGTNLAYEQTGQGPPVLLVASALADRGAARRFAEQLATHFTVLNYDRRGRGKSSDTQPYDLQREVEDIEALIDACGGPVHLFGSSSGAVLALDAASRLGGKVRRLVLYEPPLIVDNSWPPMAEGLAGEAALLTAAGRRDEAVQLFFSKGMGIPPPAVTAMRYLMPGWSKMTGMAHTIPYDLSIVAGTQTGKPLPRDRWSGESTPALVAVGSRSELFFHHGAQALAGMLPHAQYVTLEGQDHSAVLLAPRELAALASEFFRAGNKP